MTLPWKMSSAAWEIFKLAPQDWEKEVAAGRLAIADDGLLVTTDEYAAEKEAWLAEMRAWIAEPVRYFDGETNRIWTGLDKGDDSIRRRGRVQREPLAPWDGIHCICCPDGLSAQSASCMIWRSHHSDDRLKPEGKCWHCSNSQVCDCISCHEHGGRCVVCS